MAKQLNKNRDLFINIKTKDKDYEFRYNIVGFTVDDDFVTITTSTQLVSIPVRLIIEIEKHWGRGTFWSSEPFSAEQYKKWESENE